MEVQTRDRSNDQDRPMPQVEGVGDKSDKDHGRQAEELLHDRRTGLSRSDDESRAHAWSERSESRKEGLAVEGKGSHEYEREAGEGRDVPIDLALDSGQIMLRQDGTDQQLPPAQRRKVEGSAAVHAHPEASEHETDASRSPDAGPETALLPPAYGDDKEGEEDVELLLYTK